MSHLNIDERLMSQHAANNSEGFDVARNGRDVATASRHEIHLSTAHKYRQGRTR